MYWSIDRRRNKYQFYSFRFNPCRPWTHDLPHEFTPRVYYPFSFGHCWVCPSIYGFWLPLWHLRLTASDYPLGILDVRLLITPLVSLIQGFWLPLWYLWFTASDYPFGIFDLRLLITPLVSLIYAFSVTLSTQGILWIRCGFCNSLAICYKSVRLHTITVSCYIYISRTWLCIWY